MAVTNFIPTVWSASLLMALRNALVYAQAGVVNTDYEGDIAAFGDTVRIGSVGDPTIKDYTKNANMDDPEELNTATQLLTIDQAKYFNFSVDDVDNVQMNPRVMNQAMQNAAWGLRDVADTYVATTMAAAIPAANQYGTTASPKTIAAAADAYAHLVNLSVLLDVANVPVEGRWCVIPPWFHGYLLQDDRFTKAGTDTSDAVLRNGRIGRAAGFTLLSSNKVPIHSTANYKIMAGTSHGFSYAEQILKMEAFRPEKRFSDAVKGLHVYGGKVVRPSNLAMLVVTKP
jgi:hypothetical protein